MVTLGSVRKSWNFEIEEFIIIEGVGGPWGPSCTILVESPTGGLWGPETS